MYIKIDKGTIHTKIKKTQIIKKNTEAQILNGTGKKIHIKLLQDQQENKDRWTPGTGGTQNKQCSA